MRTTERPDRFKSIPDSCGVYIFRNAAGSVLYVGKAVNLRRRVRSYFARKPAAEKSMKDGMAEYIRDIECISCETELHALLLEDELIKRHRPPYNRRQKKYLSQVYLGVVDAPYPYLKIVGREEAAILPEVYGPFKDEFYAAEVLDLIARTIGLRGCSGTLPKAPCVLRDIGSCSAPCTGAVSEGRYLELLERARGFLTGADSRVVELLSERMFELSRRGEFEPAARVRDQMYFAGSFVMRQNFFHSFRSGAFLLRSTGRWQGTFLFRRGELLLYSQNILDDDICLRYLDGTGEDRSAGLPDHLMYDRAAIVSSWTRRDRENRRFSFLAADCA